MSLKKFILLFITFLFLYSCADYNVGKSVLKKEKIYYSSSGFTLIYEDSLYTQKVINKKINNDEIIVMHNLLKPNTPVKIINPSNSKFIETKISKKADYPKIFNSVISMKVAKILELSSHTPLIEIIETKKNKTFVAKESNIFEEEKSVAEKAPVDEIEMDTLSNIESENEVKLVKKSKFILVISDFYYLDSASNLKKELIKKTQFNNFFVKKISNNKYRLIAGPFENFNALKTSYISLNNLGFEGLNIYRE